MATVSPDELIGAVTATLEEYSEEVTEAVNAAVEAGAKKFIKDVRERSPSETGRYKKGWKSKKTETGVGKRKITATVYNANKPGLTHLLEKGHQKAGGGRQEGVPHISVAVDAAQRYFPELIQDAIERGG